MKLGETKVGLSQTNTPPPLNYRKFLNAMLILIIPATATFMLSLPLSEFVKQLIPNLLIFLTAVLKGIGMILGNGQVYAPSNEAVEKAQTAQIEKED